MIKPASKAKTHELTTSIEPNRARDIIVRDTIVNVRVKVGRGAAATEFEYPFRVLGIYEKYYNKWYLGKVPKKLWPRNEQEKDEKKYKLDIRMLDKDAVNECADVPMYHADFTKKNVYQTIEDSQIVSIVGQLFDPSDK